MIGQCLSNKNESVTVSKSKKFLDLNKTTITLSFVCGKYSLRPFLIVACASQKTTAGNYILKNINIYNT